MSNFHPHSNSLTSIELLSTDFDGTLVNFGTNEQCVSSLAIELEKVSYNKGLWIINTGRPLDFILEGLEALQAPVQPHYLLTNERHIYGYAHGNLASFDEWNNECDKLHQELFDIAAPFLEEVLKFIATYRGEVTVIKSRDGFPEELIATSDALMDEVSDQLLHLPHCPESFFFQRSDVYLRFCHRFYNKGTSLKELSRFLQMKPENILAVGDHCNDLAMFDGEVAKMTGCPSNAHRHVKDQVNKLGGYIAAAQTGEGTAETIAFYRQK